MRSFIIIALILPLGVLAQEAEEESPTPEQKAEVGQCYGMCLNMWRENYIKGWEFTDDYRLVTTLFNSSGYLVPNSMYEDEIDKICELIQAHVRTLDGCNAVCADLETAYGEIESGAKSRFATLFAAVKAPVETAGLWVDYDTSPAPGTTTFDTACDLYLQ